MKTTIELMYSVRNNNPLYQYNLGETKSSSVSTSNPPPVNDSSSHEPKALSNQPPKISSKSKNIDPDTERSPYVPEKSLPNQNPNDTHIALRKAMEKEWENIIQLRSRQSTNSQNFQTFSSKSESDEIISSDSDTNVEEKTSGNSPRFEEAEKFYELGLKYYEGKNENPNFIEAAKFFTSAANLGHANAQFNLGRMYETGKGIEQSFKKAAECYEKAALQGNPNAQCNLGVLLEAGEGVNKDVGKAIDWYQKAATQGNIVAKFNLAEIYEYGQGVEKNEALATKWYAEAAELGDL